MKNLFILKICLIAILIHSINSELGIDLSTLTSQSSFECFLKQKYTFVNIRAWRSYAAVDPNAPQTIVNARKAGYPKQNIGVYMFPCSNNAQKPAKDQANAMVDFVKNSEYSTIWIDLQTNTSPGCGWSETNFDQNCNFMTELVNALKPHGKKVGMYASHYMWIKIMGGQTKCSKFNDLPLWYAHYDNKPEFSDWTAFGGWKSPYAKQYKGTTAMCQASVDLNFRANQKLLRWQ